MNNFNELLRGFKEKSRHSLGYPTNHNFNYKELYPFMDYMINNVGDPFLGGSLYSLNTHDIEREVIEWFADLYNAPKDNFWGYVTNGGTEGNMYGMYLAREAFPHSVLYFSESTHYSVRKLAHILDMTYVIIKSIHGCMDMTDFLKQVSQRRDKAAIVFANIGTTMKGATDNIKSIKDVLMDLSIHHYIHADAALFGMVTPFSSECSPINFNDGIDSISVSGHKMIGMPFPSGIVVARKHFVDRVKSPVEYIGSLDTTISGSRNALSPLMFKYAIENIDFYAIVAEIMKLSNYTAEKIKGYRHNGSNIIWFKKPSRELIEKWQLATEGDYSHIVVMPHVTKEMVDQFIKEYNDDMAIYSDGAPL
jgi:histidine decarboxylase